MKAEEGRMARMSFGYNIEITSKMRRFGAVFTGTALMLLSSTISHGVSLGNDYDVAGLIGACGFTGQMPAGYPFDEKGVKPSWRWDSRNPMFGREFNPTGALAYSRQSSVGGFSHATCEALVLDGLLAEGGAQQGRSLVAQRCQSYQHSFHSRKRNLESATNMARKSRFSGHLPEVCKNPNNQNKAHFACAFAKHESQFSDFNVQLDAMNDIESICTAVGMAPKEVNSAAVARRAAGFDPYSQQYQCFGGVYGNGNIIINQPKRRGLEIASDMVANIGAIWALDRANKRQNHNAHDAIAYNYKLGLGSIVTSGANGQMGFISGASGAYGGFAGAGFGAAGGCSGYGAGGFAGGGVIGGIGGAGSIYGHGAYSPCGYGMGYGSYNPFGAGGGYGAGYPYGYGGGYPYGYGGYGAGYPYGAGGYGAGYPYGGQYGYPYFGGAGGAGGYPWGGGINGGSPYFGGYGGAGAYANAILKDMKQMQHYASELSQQEKQMQAYNRDMQRLYERGSNLQRNYYSTYGQFSTLASNFGGYGAGGYGAGGYRGPAGGYGAGAYYGGAGYGAWGGTYGGGQYCLVSPCSGGASTYYPPYGNGLNFNLNLGYSNIQ